MRVVERALQFMAFVLAILLGSIVSNMDDCLNGREIPELVMDFMMDPMIPILADPYCSQSRPSSYLTLLGPKLHWMGLWRTLTRTLTKSNIKNQRNP